MRILIFTILFICSMLTSVAQSKYDSVYVGKVEGMNFYQFEKEHNDDRSIWADSLLGIQNITRSNYDIEIRLYESPTMSVTGCTILYFDSEFHIKSYVQPNSGLKSSYTAITLKPNSSIQPDSTFSAIVEQGIFELSGRPAENKDKLALVKGKLVQSKSLWGHTDYTMYSIQTKVKGIFNEFGLSGADMAEQKYFPDNKIAERMISITNMLRLDPLLGKKKTD